jgi:hypothetical protein
MIAGIIIREFVGANAQVVPATLMETGDTACTGPVTVTFLGTAPTATLVVTSAAAATANQDRYRMQDLLNNHREQVFPYPDESKHQVQNPRVRAARRKASVRTVQSTFITQEPSALERLRALGFPERDAGALADHFLDAERRGKLGHGLARIDWLARLEGLDPAARPARIVSEPGFQRWDGGGAVGYLTLAAICDTQLAEPPQRARVVVAANCFPTGMLGYWVRRLAEGGLAAALTATSPPRLAHPDGDEPLVGTTPLAIGVPSSDGRPLVSDVSMGKVTHGDVIAGLAAQEDLVPFGGDQSHKAFALATGLQLLVQALDVESHGALLVVARPEADPVPAFRAAASGLRLPGDS